MRIHRRLWESGNAGKRHISIIRMEPQSIVGSRCGYRKSERERVLVPPSILSVAQRGRKQEEGQGELRRGTMALGRVPHRWSFFLLKFETTVAWEMAEVTGPDRGCSLRLGRGTKSYWSGRRGPRGEGVGGQGRQRSQGRQQEGYLVKCKTCR